MEQLAQMTETMNVMQAQLKILESTDSPPVHHSYLFFSITPLTNLPFLTSALISVWISLPLDKHPWLPVGFNDYDKYLCDVSALLIVRFCSNSSLIHLEAVDKILRGDLPPSVFDTYPSPGSPLSAWILCHLWGSKDVSPSNKVHQKGVCSI